MKLKTIFSLIAAIGLAVFLIIVTWNIKGKRDLKKFNAAKIQTEREHQSEIAEYNSKDYQIEVDEEYYRLKYQKKDELAKKKIDQSYQDPSLNEKYDVPDASGDMEEFFADDQISDEELSYYFEEKSDSTRIKYEYKDLFILQGDIIHHDLYQGRPPYLEVNWLPLDITLRDRKRFDAMIYVGFDSGAVTVGYEVFPWLKVGIMEDVRKVIIDNEEKILFNSMIGVGIKW